MHVVLGVGMQVMVAMLGGPPQHALLHAALRHEGQDELKRPAGRIGAVREIAMVAGPDEEDAHPIERDADHQRLPGDAGPQRGHAREMDEHERDGARIDDIVVRTSGVGGATGAGSALGAGRLR
jgi:hypothetical protein